MIVQVICLSEELAKKKDELQKSSGIKLNISGLEKNQIETLSGIGNDYKINFENFSSPAAGKLSITIPSDNFQKLLDEMQNQNLQEFSNEILNAVFRYKKYDKIPVEIGETEFNQTVIMGILNVTPDSFSDAGKYFDEDSAVEHALEMIHNGADIIDIGGESTRPGSDPVSEEEELRRVIPVIQELIKRKPEAVISIDTTKSKVAGEACKAGAKIINDISGLTFDPEISDVAKEYSASLIIMHIKGTPKTMHINPAYDDLIFEIFEFLFVQIEKAKNAGVKNIIIDPGIGFGKRIEDNFEILGKLSDFKSLGYPILIGLSRKSFLGKTLNLDLDKRDTATAVAEAAATINGAKIIRTHNVLNAVRTRELLSYIYHQ